MPFKKLLQFLSATLFLLILVTNQGLTQGPVVESFDYSLYSSCDTLLGQAGEGWGSGWDFFEGTEAVWSVVDTAIDYNNLIYPVPNLGYHAAGRNPWEWAHSRIARRLDQTWTEQAGSSIWLSVVYDLTDDFSDAGWAIVGFYYFVNDTDYNELNGVGHEWGNDSLGLATYSPPGHSNYTMLDDPQWMVVRVITSGDTMPDHAYLWVSPDPSLGEPDTTFADAKGDWNIMRADVPGFNAVAAHFGGGHTGMMAVDEIRLGTSWADVSFDFTSVEEALGGLPEKFTLEQNYPNPFNPSTNIKYVLDKKSRVRLTVYDVTGKEIARLVDGYQDAGEQHVTFAAENLPSGVYFYKLQANGQAETRKMMLIR